MQTLLSNQRSNIGSPYVYYNLYVTPSNRTASYVNLTFTLEATLRSGSYINSGSLTGWLDFENDQTRRLDVYTGGSWSGSTKTITDTFTLPANASATSLPVTFSVDRSGGNAGTLNYIDLSIDIPIGHLVPSDITYTMTETNPLLVSAGISNNLIVENLSIKQFAIDYTLHEGATLVGLGMYNRAKTFQTTSSPISIDLRSNTLNKATNDNTKIPLRAFVKDSFVTQGLSSETLYDYITYTPITLTETSTIVKRDGQVSGKANLTVNGTYYTGTIGNVSQATYKPTVKYKFWRSDATEPSTYAYTIPSSSVTISNGTFSVSNYAIGSSSTSATNYFNPDYSYKVKVEVDDNFSTYYSVEKSIPVGEATWTEYIDHVDFKKITIGGEDVITNLNNNGGRLVASASGRNVGTIELTGLDIDKDYQYEIWVSFNPSATGTMAVYPNGRTTVPNQFIQDNRVNGTNHDTYNRSTTNQYLYIGDLTNANNSTLLIFRISKGYLDANNPNASVGWYTVNYQMSNAGSNTGNNTTSWGGGQFQIASNAENITSITFAKTGSGNFSNVFARCYRL